ncbi:methyl-accepting chemotaxis protein [Balneolales bacterium ANBcel1]|nr:methyl-accepting chemotaxis protein [Balneolales bacterium ANBcel1]
MNIFNNIKLRYKILVFPAIFVLVVGVIYYTTQWSNESVGRELDTVQYSHIPYNDLTNRMTATQRAVQQSFQDGVAAQDINLIDNTAALAQEFRQLADSARAIRADNNYELLDRTVESFNRYYRHGVNSSTLMIEDDYSENVSESVQAMIGELEVLRDLLEQISSVEMHQAFENARGHLAELRQTINMVLFVSLGLFVVISLLLSQAISGALKKMVDNILRLSDGHLDIKVPQKFLHRKDEIGDISRAVDDLVSKLTEVIVGVQNESNHINEISRRLEETSSQMAKGSGEQASFVEEISSTMEQVSANINQNARNAQETNSLSSEANTKLKDVGSRSQDAINANRTITERINQISDIAFQTNVLALNAAIEAARAGDAGKGFAVVAEEVQMLAEKSKTAADEIVELTKTAYNLANRAGEVMFETIPKIDKTSTLVQEISMSSDEQSKGADQVNQSIQQLSTLSQQSAASSQELAASAEDLMNQAERLKQSIAYYKLGGLARQQNGHKPLQVQKPQPKGMNGHSKKPSPEKEIAFELN